MNVKGKKVYNEIDTVNSLMKKECYINYSYNETRNVKGIDILPRTINVSRASPLGNSSWGKISYLLNKCKYNIIKTKKNGNKRRNDGKQLS